MRREPRLAQSRLSVADPYGIEGQFYEIGRRASVLAIRCNSQGTVRANSRLMDVFVRSVQSCIYGS